MTQDEDAVAIGRVLAGDREAFGLLVARYGRRVHDLARRMLRDAHEAEDAAQQVFLNAYRALPRFDPRRPFRHWLLRIATDACRNRLAARRAGPRVGSLTATDPDGASETLDPADPAGDPASEGEGPAFPSDARLDAERVRAAIEDLPDTYRLAVVLRYAQGLSLEEVSEITGEPGATVKTHLHRGRAAQRRRRAGPQEAGATPKSRAGTT